MSATTFTGHRPFGCDCARHVRFSERVMSRASLRTSSVLRPSCRSNSRIRSFIRRAARLPPLGDCRQSPAGQRDHVVILGHGYGSPTRHQATPTIQLVQSNAIPARDARDAGAVLQGLLDDPHPAASQRRRRPPSRIISSSDIGMCLGICPSLHDYARVSGRNGGRFRWWWRRRRRWPMASPLSTLCV